MSEAGRAPEINIDEQEYPDHVNEVPIPGGRFKTDMLIRFEMTFTGTNCTHGQEAGTDKNVETVKASRQIEGRRIYTVRQTEGGFGVFMNLKTQKDKAEYDGDPSPKNRLATVAVDQSVVSIGDCGARGQQNERV